MPGAILGTIIARFIFVESCMDVIERSLGME